MAEITDKGFKLKTQNEYFEEERDLYLGIDADWNLDPSSPDGLKLAKDAETFGNLDEVAQAAYNSKDPNKAKGHDLEVICALTGTKRDKGSRSIAPVTIGGVVGTQIFEGDIVESTEDGTEWEITDPVRIGSNGTITANVRCTKRGAIVAPVDTLTKIVTVRGGWQTVTNQVVSYLGRGVQQDPALRRERKLTVALPGSNMVESMYGALGTVDGVNRFVIYENDEKTTDSNGLPGNSLAIFVDGGDDQAVADAIYSKRGPGTKQFQPTVSSPVTKTVQSKKFPQIKQVIKFNRPAYVDIRVAYNIKNDGTLPANVAELIKDAVMSYVEGTLIDSSCGFNPLGFNIAEDVNAGRLYTPANQVIGQYGNSYVSNTTVNGTARVPINFKSMSRFTRSNITVNVS